MSVPAWVSLFLFALLSTTVVAQPASQAVRFTVFAAKPISGLAFVPRPKADPQKLQFYPTARSPQYEYHGAMPLRFVDATTAEVVAEVIIPPGMRDALLLLTPSDGAGSGAAARLRYQVSVLDDGAARHGPGGLAMINFSGLALTGTVNSEKVTVNAGLNPTLKVGRSAKITFSTTAKGRSYQSYAGTVTLERNERALLILFPPFYQGSLEVQSRLLVDQPPGTAAPKPPTPKQPAPTPPAPKR